MDEFLVPCKQPILGVGLGWKWELFQIWSSRSNSDRLGIVQAFICNLLRQAYYKNSDKIPSEEFELFLCEDAHKECNFSSIQCIGISTLMYCLNLEIGCFDSQAEQEGATIFYKTEKQNARMIRMLVPYKLCSALIGPQGTIIKVNPGSPKKQAGNHCSVRHPLFPRTK